MPKSIQKSSVSNAVFYKPVEGVKEARTGYLWKSPPPSIFKTKKSWKRRYFVLFKMQDESCQLKYFKSSEDREKPCGGIELSKISLLYSSPQKHIQWPWIDKNFKCSVDSVLYIKTRDREYFLIGEDSSDIDGWFWDIYEALKYRPHQVLDPEVFVNTNCMPKVLADDSSFSVESLSDPDLRVFTLKKTATFVKEDCNTQPGKDRSKSESAMAKPMERDDEKESQRSQRSDSEPVNHHYDFPKSPPRKAFLAEEHAWRPLSEQVKEPKRFLKHTRQTQPGKDRSASEPSQAMAKPTESDDGKESQQSRRPCSAPARNSMELAHDYPIYMSIYDYPKSFLRKTSLGNEEVTSGPGPVAARRALSEQVKEPENNNYDFPDFRKFLKLTRQESEDEEAGEDDGNSYYMKMETVFEAMKEAEEKDKDSRVQSFEEDSTNSLLRSVTQVYDKLKTCGQWSVPTEAEAGPDESRVDCQADCDSSPTENETAPPVVITQSKHLKKHSSIESKEAELVAEKDILVNQADLKEHLIVSDVDGKPCVFSWTGQSQTTCPFHTGDRILAINDLQTGSVEEFQTYLGKLLREQVTLTILRLPGSEPMHSCDFQYASPL